MALLTKKKQKIGSDSLKVSVALLIKNQQEIGSNLLIKLFKDLLTKNQQEIGSHLFKEDIYVC